MRTDRSAPRKLSLSRLATKVGWEGGILATIDYGVRSADIDDPEVATLWAEIEALYDQMVPVMGKVDRRIREARPAYEAVLGRNPEGRPIRVADR